MEIGTKVIGNVAFDLTIANCYFVECPAGDFMSDASAYAVKF